VLITNKTLRTSMGLKIPPPQSELVLNEAHEY
jgi:hypothetical protein